MCGACGRKYPGGRSNIRSSEQALVRHAQQRSLQAPTVYQEPLKASEQPQPAPTVPASLNVQVPLLKPPI